MRRRRALAYGAAAVGLAGYGWTRTRPEDERESSLTTPTEATKRTRTATPEERSKSSVVSPSIGGSLNGRFHRLDRNFELIEKSGTRWLHTFLDVRKKYERGVDPRSDPDVATLRRVSRETDLNLMVALKWNFTGNFGNVEQTRVPPSGSSRRRALFEYATKLLLAIGRPVDVLALGNEPIWEAPDKDVLGRNSTLISFTRELKNHLVANYTADARLLVGSFNKLYSDYVRRKYGSFYQQLFDMARTDGDIDGVDLHIHYDGLQQAENMLAVARNELSDGTVTISEYSPVWRYDRNKNTPIGAWKSGRKFADQYGFAPETTATEYYQAAQKNPRSPREMADFMEAMPWYNVNFVEDLYDLMNRYDVDVGTFGFLQAAGFNQMDLTDDWTPFQINYLFQRGVIDSDDGAHPHYLEDLRNRA